MPIPNLTECGELPTGIHLATVEEVEQRFGRSSEKRKLLMSGVKRAITQFRKAHIQRIYIDGSFTTDKSQPNDVDGCWASEGVKSKNLLNLDADFWNFNSIAEFQECRERTRNKYGLDFFIAEAIEGESGKPFPGFFQTNKDGEPKGIIQVNL